MAQVLDSFLSDLLLPAYDPCPALLKNCFILHFMPVHARFFSIRIGWGGRVLAVRVSSGPVAQLRKVSGDYRFISKRTVLKLIWGQTKGNATRKKVIS